MESWEVRNMATQLHRLEQVRQNSSETTVIHSSMSIPNYYTRLGEALENNTHVTEIYMLSHLSPEDSIDKLLLFIEKSETLQKLFCPAHSCREHEKDLFLALSRRSKGLDFLKLPRISPENMEYLHVFLLHTPTIKRLNISYYSFGDDVNRLLAPLESQSDFGLPVLTAVATAPIEKIEIPNDRFQWQILEAFKHNPFLKFVDICFDQTIDDLQELPHLLVTCALLRACRNANFEVSLSFDFVGSWDRGVWLTLSNELKDHDSIKALLFENMGVDLGEEDFVVKLLPKLFQGTRRKLEISGERGLSERLLDAIVASTHFFDPTYASLTDDQWKYLMSALARPTSVVEVLHLAPFSVSDFDAFIKWVPQFKNLKSLSLQISLLEECDEDDNDLKSRILKALWSNRSLTEKIHLDGTLINGNDHALMDQIVQRNKFLPGMLDPKNLLEMNSSLVPHLFMLSSETDVNELFETIRSVNLPHLRGSAPTKRKRRHAISWSDVDSWLWFVVFWTAVVTGFYLAHQFQSQVEGLCTTDGFTSISWEEICCIVKLASGPGNDS